MIAEIIRLNGMNIEVYESGKDQKKSLVFAHGLGGNLRQWRQQVDAFPDYHVIAFSLQGHGRSDHPSNEDAYSIKAYGDTVDALVDKLNVKSCVWVGNSMGGVIGYEMKKRHPELISNLITNGTTPELIMGGGLLKIMEIMDKLLIKAMKFDGYIKFASGHISDYEHARKAVGDMFKETSPQTIISSHQVLGRYSYTDILKNSRLPVSVIYSPKDKGINSYLKKLKIESYECVKIAVINDTGHVCNIEQPEEYNRVLRSLIEDSSAHP